MKLSKFIEYAKRAFEEHGDVEINACYCPGDAWMRIDVSNYEQAFSYNEKGKELLINIG